MYHRNSLVDILVDWIIDRLFDFGKAIFGKKKEPEEFTAIKIVPETDPDRRYHDWLKGERMMLNALPEVQLTILRSERSVDEIVEAICSDNPYVSHTGHEKDSCPGKPLAEGLKEIFSGQPSSWEIRYAIPSAVYKVSTNIAVLEMFLAQEFEGSVPGNPNRDICHVYIDRNLAPMELEIRIPHYGVRDGFCTVVYLKIELSVDPVTGVNVVSHEDNTDPRPR